MNIAATDWSRLEHAYGLATDVPALWAAFLRGDPQGTYADGASASLAAAICHQGTVYTATRALVPSLVATARTEGQPARTDALYILAAILDGHGSLEQRARLAREPLRLRHPSSGALVLYGGPGTEPDPDELAEERAWVHAMKVEISLHRAAWRALASHPDDDLRTAATELLAALERVAAPF